MKKAENLILFILIGFLFLSCNNSTSVKNSESSAAKTDEKKCMKAMTEEETLKFISKQLEVKGEVENPLTLTVDSLMLMKAVLIDSFKIVCQSGAEMGPNKTCKGVLLKDILEKAKIKQTGHKDRNFYIVARATDDYMATFSWAEIFNNITGENTFVIFEENGQPIKEKGQMELICNSDLKTGPRHVFWLKSIEVYRVK